MSLPESPRLFLIDGYGLIYRAFFALISRPLTTTRGENTSAAWGIANFLNDLRTRHRPEYLAWVHDSGLSFRQERYPPYKATRSKLTDDLQSDFDRGMSRINQLLNAHRIPILSLDGFEADDVIGTLVTHAAAQKLNAVVVSADKDFQQLIQPGVWLLNPGRGGPSGVKEHWIGMANAVDRFGVTADRIVDYLALVGDPSDNIPGVKGIGEKTARALVSRYGDLESILNSATQIEQKRCRDALIAQADTARLSKELVTIRKDLPIALDLDLLTLRDADAAYLREVYAELEFVGLSKSVEGPRLMVVDTDQPPSTRVADSVVAKEIVNYATVDTPSALSTVVSRARAQGTVSIGTVTTVPTTKPLGTTAHHATLVGIALGISPGEAYYFPLGHEQPPTTDPDLGIIPGAHEPQVGAEREVTSNLPDLHSEAMHPLRDLIEDADIQKTCHDAKSDLLVLRKIGVKLSGLAFDTQISSYLLNPQRRSHDLTALAAELLRWNILSYEEITGRGRASIPFSHISLEAATSFACRRVDVMLRLRRLFASELAQHGLVDLAETVEFPLTTILADMEWLGIRVDVSWFVSLKASFRSERERLEHAIYALAGKHFNINSNVQLREILFHELELPVRKRTATGPSTDAGVLRELAEAGHEVPTLILDYRELTKLENTYLDTLPGLVDPRDNRLHTCFNQTVAATGRLSSSEPNLQNIPIRRPLGRDIRKGFVPRDRWLLMSADYSQVELRILAHLSGDAAFVEAFQSGGDIHQQTAARIFEVEPNAVTSEMRARAKTINFATIYGQGAHALARQLRINFAEAKEFITRYFERFQGVRAFLDKQIALGYARGYVETIYGRRRYIPELHDKSSAIRAFGERTAANSPIQGSAADLIKVAMIHITAAFARDNHEAKLLVQVHDELLFELPPQEVNAVRDLVRYEMEHAIELSIPLAVVIGVGDNWLAAKGG